MGPFLAFSRNRIKTQTHWIAYLKIDLAHLGRVTVVCVAKLTIIGSDNGLSSGRHQAVIWTNAWILLIGPLGTSFSDILIGIETSWFKKIHVCEMVSILSRPQWLNKMAAIQQTTLSNAFSWMKMLEFRLKFHWSLFLRVQLTIFQHWFR